MAAYKLSTYSVREELISCLQITPHGMYYDQCLGIFHFSILCMTSLQNANVVLHVLWDVRSIRTSQKYLWIDTNLLVF